jgi:hypothetical protein
MEKCHHWFSFDPPFPARVLLVLGVSFGECGCERKCRRAAIDNSSGFGQWVNFANYRLSRSLSSYDMRHNFVISYVWLIPFDRAFPNATKRLTEGWQLNGITRFSTGLPVGIGESDVQSLAGSIATDVPNLVGPLKTQNPRKPGPNGANTFFFPDAFASGPFGAFGNANRQFFHGPGIANTDLRSHKATGRPTADIARAVAKPIPDTPPVTTTPKDGLPSCGRSDSFKSN